jgi:hypothetical protein
MENINHLEIDSIMFPEIPLPWERSKRIETINHLFADYPRDNSLSDSAAEETREYIKSFMSTYLMPGKVGVAISDSLYFSNDLEDDIYTTKTDRDYMNMMRRFEHDFLGLEPTQSSEGLRWAKYDAGFSNGVYPTQAVADVFSMTSEALVAYIAKNQSPSGWVTARANKYIFPITASSMDPASLIIAGVQELSSRGQTLVETSILVCEAAFRNNTNSNAQV